VHEDQRHEDEDDQNLDHGEDAGHDRKGSGDRCGRLVPRLRTVTDEAEARERIRKLLVTGDNRLKQGVDPEKARASWEQALEVAREAGLEDAVRPLVEVRLADLRQSSPPPG
jgi:hypothetical protein